MTFPITNDYEVFSGIPTGAYQKVEPSIHDNNDFTLLAALPTACPYCILIEEVKHQNSKYYDLAKLKKKVNEKFWLQDKDILVTLKGGRYRAIFLKTVDPLKPYSVNSNTAIIRAKHDNPAIDPEGICFYLNSAYFIRTIVQKNQVGYNNISISTLSKVEIPTPNNKQKLNNIFYANHEVMTKNMALLETTQYYSEQTFLSELQAED